MDQCATAWCSSGNDGYVHLWLHVHIQVTLGNLQKMHSFVSWKSISLQCPIPTTALGLLPCNQGGYTEESQTTCLLVLVVHKPKFGNTDSFSTCGTHSYPWNKQTNQSLAILHLLVLSGIDLVYFWQFCQNGLPLWSHLSPSDLWLLSTPSLLLTGRVGFGGAWYIVQSIACRYHVHRLDQKNMMQSFFNKNMYKKPGEDYNCSQFNVCLFHNR